MTANQPNKAVATDELSQIKQEIDALVASHKGFKCSHLRAASNYLSEQISASSIEGAIYHLNESGFLDLAVKLEQL